jgi:antitoxin HicB
MAAAVPFYPVTFEADETGSVIARFADWPNIVTGGDTLEEAVANAHEALAATIAYYEDEGLPLPQPLAEHTGQINVRVPRSLHRVLKRRAAEEGVSLNALVNYLLTGATQRAA